MYRVYCDGLPIYDLRSEELVLLSPKVSLIDSNAGSFDFTITHKHPRYDDIKKMVSEITVFQDDDEIFCGRITEEKSDFFKRKTCHCEGELAYLNDSTQNPAEYHDQTVRGFLQTLVNIHNQKVSANKQFQVGMVTVTDPNDSLYRYTNWETTLECINEKLVKKLGGHLRIRKLNGIRYIDYLQDYPNTNTQVIKFGRNLLDFTKNFDMTGIATVVIPLGAKLDESPIEALEAYTTISSVNGGLNYLKSTVAVNTYGWIEKVVKWDDVHVPDILKSKGQAYLNDIQYEDMVLEIKAVDLHNLDVDEEAIKLLDEIRATSDVHGMDRYFPVTKVTISLDKPSQATFTLGDSMKQSLTSSTSKTNSSLLSKINAIPNKSEIIKEAQDNATQLIRSATNGHVVTTAEEQLIMDTDDKETARKVWRWNLNGLGYSNTGYEGQYNTAITMDGQIVGERLVGGSVSAEKLDINYRSEVEKKITLAEENAEGYTDDKLAGYWTKVQVETAIKNTGDSILISAKETATAYTDNKLKNYSTSAQIKVITDSITSEVNKKVNNSEFGTKITQNAYNVRVAWNNNSNYVQFEGGSIALYNGAVSTSQKREVFDQNGNHFYRDGYYVGKIGTNHLQSDSSKKGLNFNLEYTGAYMTWASQDYSSAPTYTMKWTYVQKNKGWGNYTAGELHAGCNINMHNWTLKNVNFEGGGITGTMYFVQIKGMSSNGTASSWVNNAKMQFKNGILISGTWN